MILFILQHAHGTKAIITWFADYHAALIVFTGRLLHVPVVIFAGGMEAVCYPELKKGVYCNKFRGMFAKYALRNATLIIPNHKSLIYHENFYYDPAGKKDGIKFYIPDIATKFAVVPNGIDTTKFFRDPSIRKEPGLILTVGTMNSVYDFINKGFDLFIRVAERNPDLEFILIGLNRKFLPWVEENYHISKIVNLKVVFYRCPQETLFFYYNRAKVFVQASITEGMPNTISEAMLCECIPVGSNVNGIPDAIGSTGLLLNTRSAGNLETCIHEALKMENNKEISNYVIQNFAMSKREERIIQVLKDQAFI